MKTGSKLTRRERIYGGLWGSLVGDALGVPVEFKDRATVQRDPVLEMRGNGSHGQPPGTWSDDSSLILCTVESLLEHAFDTEDMGRRFVRWRNEGIWTPYGKVFDIGIATSEALARIAQGVPAEFAGGESEHSNGNGSLMRILPVSMRFADAPQKELLNRVHRASALTHRHRRSQLACGMLTLLVRELFGSAGPTAAFQRSIAQFSSFYGEDPFWSVELRFFEQLSSSNVQTLPENEIVSGGYVVHTLTAAIWCFLTTGSFEECVLRAVNLGGDTDTTGSVAGGLAGVHYGVGAIRSIWMKQLAQHEKIAAIFDRFVELCA